MTRQEILQRLQTTANKGNEALRLLDSKPLSAADRILVQSLAQSIKEELRSEYTRMLPERVQKSMTLFEMTIYSPTIEETWKHSGISRLNTDGSPDQKWQTALEAVVYKVGVYLS